jgi:uncharacterized membrane protein
VIRASRSKDAWRTVLASLFIAAGVLHFVSPGFYMPWALPTVYLSGLAEIGGGAGLLVRKARPLAGLWLIAVLIAVYPANVYMALESEKFGLPTWALYARLPLQFVLIAWAWWCSRDDV